MNPKPKYETPTIEVLDVGSQAGPAVNGTSICNDLKENLHSLTELMNQTENPGYLDLDKEKAAQGLAKLVLTIIELIRRLMEKQAMVRVEHGSLTDEQLEELGVTLMRLEEKMEELKKSFGLENEDLNLNLGPLGNLL